MPPSAPEVDQDLSRVLLARVPSMLAYFDASLHCRFANEAYAQAVGVAAGEVVGRSMEALLGAAEFASRRPFVDAALNGQRQTFERRTAAPVRDLLVSYVPDAVGGAIAGFAVEITDVTSLRAAQEALSNSEARFRTLSESSPLGVYFADLDGKRNYMNLRWQEIYGLSAADGRGDGWLRAVHEDDREAVSSAWRDMALLAQELELSFRIRRGGDGSVRVVRTRTRPVRDGVALIGFVGALEDITDRRQDEERLRSSEAFLDRTGRVARIGGWQVDLRTRDVQWSAQMRRICDVDDDYVPDYLRADQFYPPQAWAELSAALARAIEHGENWDLELPFVTAKQRRLWVRVFGEVEVVDDVPIRLIGVLQDVTEQRRQRVELAQELERRQESERHAAELDRLLRERSEMLDVLAHEVRQPLNNASAAIQGASSVLAEMHELTASSRLARAQNVLGQVMASIDNTLAVASLLARPDPLQLADTDIDALLAVCVADVLPAERGRIRIERDTDARAVPMDMSLMRLALRNLLANAVRYSPAESPVTMRIADSERPPGLRLEVSSTGGGDSGARGAAPVRARGQALAGRSGALPGAGPGPVHRPPRDGAPRRHRDPGRQSPRASLVRAAAGLRRVTARGQSHPFQRAFEDVPDARPRLQRDRQRGGLLDPAAQPVDDGVQPVVRVLAAAPEAFAELLPRHVGTCRLDEAVHHRHVGLAEVDRGTVRGNQLARPAIQQPGGTGARAPGASQHRLDRDLDLLELHGLDEIHVGAGVDHLREDVRSQAAGHDEHAGLRPQPEHADHVQPVDARKHQVDHVERIAIRVGRGQEAVAVVEDLDAHAPLAQVVREEFGVFGVVVDQGQGGRKHGVGHVGFSRLNHAACHRAAKTSRKSRAIPALRTNDSSSHLDGRSTGQGAGWRPRDGAARACVVVGGSGARSSSRRRSCPSSSPFASRKRTASSKPLSCAGS
jgi:PAS domain S-box-containing protein